MKQELREILTKQQEILKTSTNPNEKIGILYNLIAIKHKNQSQENRLSIYVDIKMLINNYLELVRKNDFGYDLFSEEKLLKVIGYLNIQEQQMILSYLFSVISRDFPEMEKDWVQLAIKKVKLKRLIDNKRLINLPKALFLYTSMNVSKLLIALFCLIVLVSIILLPAPYEWMAIFKIKYVTYAKPFIANHFLNVISLFVDIENSCEVTALNWLGLVVQIISKALFILLIVNFIYKKISDKFTIG